MKPGKKMDPLTQIELHAEQLAQEYKRKLIKQGMERLAAEKASEAISPPGAHPLPPGETPPAHPDNDRR